MKTSTVASGGASGGAGRRFERHMVMPNSSESMTLYVSAITNGTAIHQAGQLTEKNQRQRT